MAIVLDRERVGSSPVEQDGHIPFGQDRLLPRGRIRTLGGWILYIGDNRVWERQNGKPYQAKVGSFEVTVLSEMTLVGSERLHVFNVDGPSPWMQVILAQNLDLDILNRLE